MLNKLFHNQSKDQERGEQKSASLLNRRGLFKKGGLLVGLVSALSLTPFSWTEASAHTAADPVQVSDLTGSSAEKYLQATLTSRDYLQFKQQLAQQYPNTFTVQETAPVVMLVQDSSTKLISVHIPVQGGAGQSFFAATLQADTAALLTTRSGLFLPASNGNTAMVIQQNGTPVANAVVDLKGTFVSGTLTTSTGKNITLNGLSAKEVASAVSSASLQAPAASNSWLDCFASCMSSRGITLAAWAVAAISLACALVCPTGLGCLVCISGSTGITGSAVGYCLGQC